MSEYNFSASSIKSDSKEIDEFKILGSSIEPLQKSFITSKEDVLWKGFKQIEEFIFECRNCLDKIRRLSDSSLLTHYDKCQSEKTFHSSSLLDGKPKRELGAYLLQGLADEGKSMSSSDALIVFSNQRVIQTHKLVLGSLSPMLYEALLSLPSSSTAVIIAHELDFDLLSGFICKLYSGKVVNVTESDYANSTLGFLRLNKRAYKDAMEPEALIQGSKSEETETERKKKKTKVKGFIKQNSIWNYFSESSKHRGRNNCNICLEDVSGKNTNTFSMISHLKLYHSSLYLDFLVSSSSSYSPIQEFQKNSSKTCFECSKIFSSRNTMLSHWKAVHSGLKPYECELCDSTFNRMDSLKAHVNSLHSSSRSFLCSLCGRTFSRRNVRDMHERVHKEDRRYSCSFCSKKFFTNQQKKNHERTHTGEKPFGCPHCDRLFAMMHQLTTHLRIHTDSKPYQCSICHKTFRYSSSKNKHQCSQGSKVDDEIGERKEEEKIEEEEEEQQQHQQNTFSRLLSEDEEEDAL